jgi:sterol desaturase/sphingolipid hydroxylase (fatty acid hydroxylase superfamily)
VFDESIAARFIEGLTLPFTYVLAPDKRLYFVHLIFALILAYWVYKRSKQKDSFWRYIFAPKVWLSTSAKIDYSVAIINGVIKALMIGPWVVFGFALAFEVSNGLLGVFGRPFASPPTGLAITLYTVTIVVVGDFATYALHFAMHKIPLLWSFHQTHHAATSLNPVTQYRIHPVEMLLNTLRSMIVFGLVTGCFDYWTQQRIEPVTFLGVNVLRFAFLFWGSNLRHSHVKLRFWHRLEHILISPYQHQIHHSDQEHHQTHNLGAIFAVWDRLFGTLITSKEVDKIQFGLGENHPTRISLSRNLWPFGRTPN